MPSIETVMGNVIRNGVVLCRDIVVTLMGGNPNWGSFATVEPERFSSEFLQAFSDKSNSNFELVLRDGRKAEIAITEIHMMPDRANFLVSGNLTKGSD